MMLHAIGRDGMRFGSLGGWCNVAMIRMEQAVGNHVVIAIKFTYFRSSFGPFRSHYPASDHGTANCLCLCWTIFNYGLWNRNKIL